MNEVIKMARKAVTGAVVAATIAWSVSLSAFLAPLAAHAATSGSLVKASLPAVYYVGQDGKRYVFPNEKTYKTWYADFSSVMTITDSELAAMSIGGNVTYKPGVKMVKITTDPKVYAVSAHGTLRWVNSEALAIALYGANWNQMIEDVPDAFFTNYTVGSDITAASQFSPASASAAATSINQDKNLGSSTSVSGTLSAMLSSGQPAGGTLPGGAMGVNVLKVDVRNGGSSAATVDSLTVHRSGAGNVADISALYVYAGNDRLTTGRSINSSSNDVAFSGLNLSLAAGETKTVWIAADITAALANGGNQHSFSLTDLRSGSAMASGLPLSGPTFTMSSATVGGITISKTGSITNPKAGEMGAKIASFKLDVGTQEDVTLQRIALFQAGSISRDKLTNFVLKQAGLTIATTSGANSKDLIVFVLSNPMTLEKGNSRTFDVFADIAGSARTTDTISVYLDQTSDLAAMGHTYGYGVGVTNTLYDGAPGTDASNSTVDAGQLTITYNGPAAHDIPTNGKDVELFNFTMAAQSNLEVRKTIFTFTPDGGNSFWDAAANLTDIKTTDTATGSVVAGPFDMQSAANATCVNDTSVNGNTCVHTFTEVYNLAAGQARTFKLTADVANNAPNLMTVKATLGTFTTGNAVRNLDNSTYVTSDVVPNAAIAGNNHTIKTSTLTVSASSTPVAQTYIQGSQNVELAGWGLKAGDSQAVKVTDVTVRCYMDETGTETNKLNYTLGTDGVAICSDELLSAKLWNGATQVGTTKSPTNGGLIQFTNLNLDVPAGQTLTLKLSGNLSSSIATVNDRMFFRITTATDIVAQDVDGNTIAANVGDFDGQLMTISAAGTFTVAKASDDTESEAGLVVGGSSNVVLAKFKFNAVNDVLKLTKARLHIATASGVTSLSLYDGASLVGGPVSVDGSGNADFSGMSAFVVPKDGNKTLTVKGNLSAVGSSGTLTGSDLMVTLCDGDNDGICSGGAGNDTGTFEVRGTSAGSSTVITTAVNDVAGNSKIARKSKPTVTLVSLPSTTLSAGNQVVLRFTVSADAANEIALGELTADVVDSGTGIVVACVGGCGAANTTTIKRVGGDYLSANVTYAADVLTITLDNEESIAAGTSKTYEVYMNMTGADPSDSVSSTLRTDSLDMTDTFANVSAARNFVWSDTSATSHSFGTADWASGFKVKTLPTDSQTLVK